MKSQTFTEQIYDLAKELPNKEKSWHGSDDAEKWFKYQVGELLSHQKEELIAEFEEIIGKDEDLTDYPPILARDIILINKFREDLRSALLQMKESK